MSADGNPGIWRRAARDMARPIVSTQQPESNVELVCPHCQVKGQVSTRQVKSKQGVSGGKATGAVLTGGLSLFATGLSRKQQVTALECGNCSMVWTV